MLPSPVMRWSLLFLLLASVAVAKPKDKSAEALGVMEQFFGGQLSVNAAVNRIRYLGAENFASHELVLATRRNGDARTRERYLEMLSALEVRHQDVENTFLDALKRDSIGEVMVASTGLGRLKSPGAVKPLVGLLGHKMVGVRREAARALGLIGKPEASAPLMKAASTEQELELKVLMLQSAGRAGDRKQAPALEALLKDDSETTRMAAAQGLCAMGTPSCAKFAGRLLASADKNERMQGVMLFEGAPAKAASGALAPMLKDTDDKVRSRAARILAQGGDASKIDWLIIESSKASGEKRLTYEDEIEKLRVTDEQRQAVSKKAGLQ
ncbi:MAG: PBS lyase [Archangium gephyra]|uniref:PBS lyase n=1 Tax=Archangium gephyra TaxID=48 RepID=A0A2W5T3X2_9BACT|nr:MAG: PBS lyase [Archangium gephyra]